MERLQAEGEVFVTNPRVRGRFALRACILHFDTDENDPDALVDAVCRIGAACAGEAR